MTLSINDLFTPALGSDWLARLLANASTLGLPVTSWQSGGVGRTILQVIADSLAQEDGIISAMAQGGFLDFAANGTVTTTLADGTTITAPVTPDPSIPSQNSTGALGWLDLLASSSYDVTRIAASYAAATVAIVNTSAAAYGPFAAGTYHVANPTTRATYTNSATLTIAPAAIVGGTITNASNTAPITLTTSSPHGLSTGATVAVSGVTGNLGANGVFVVSVADSTHLVLAGSVGTGGYTSSVGTINVATVGAFAADAIGPAGTSPAGTITQPVSSLVGVSVYNTQGFAGQNWESNQALAARCRLRLQALSPNGPQGSYMYFALTAGEILAGQTPPVALGNPPTRVLKETNSITGIVNVIVASDAGAVPGVANLAITAATNASPIQITTAVPHGLSSGNFVTIEGVISNSNANGTFLISVVDSNNFTLNGSSGNAGYGGGGIVEGGDLGEVDTVIQANAVPDNTTAIVSSASTFGVTVAATVTVPLAKVAEYTLNVQSTLSAYFRALPIGGQSGFVNYNDILGVLYATAQLGTIPSYVSAIVSLLLNGSPTNLAYPSSHAVATLTPSITVIGA